MTRDTSGMLNSYSGSIEVEASTQALIERRRGLLGPAYRLFYEHPIHIVRGEGAWLFDAEGYRYLDAYNNVASVGHCHPHVVAAIARQAATLNTHTRYLGAEILDYAERILATMPDDLGNIMFTCTGSEANDLALRVARHCTGARGVIVTRLAYHGITEAVAAISPSLGFGGAQPPYVRVVSAPDSYRLGKEATAILLRETEEAIADLKAAGHGVAAMVCDTIFSSDGVFAEAGLLSEVARVVQRAGGLFIADEVQAGFARTGMTMWGFQRHDMVPDIVTMGKPMANGHPVAAAAMRPDLLASFGENTRYFNTFGGNTVSCAAAAATLDVIERQGLAAGATAIGAQFTDRLRASMDRHEAVGDVRGAGLFLGVEIVADRAKRTPDSARAQAIVNGMRDRRVLISSTGTYGNVLKIRPPLIWEEDHVAIFAEAFDATLDALC
ncbi:aminotransferase class III-fold pyridoxal phosphate-dependent enzyme [Sphingomonas sp. CL5.1]|uniref:aspartate aminotransferase family protein n=1 Tax=Sphingomonas sp. CL5.1 TaxID=2653203 RepID=UPI0015836E3B|nr:aminotransferase class III-fold pyridoxal phosphate-dependent enzyme [Sphingomonas sp. CL5.1]QKR99886.1 aminotransferase class III-fold pyridoxal phosphate-dependent enzyme [Sphingomonas sp. CL5.1]